MFVMTWCSQMWPLADHQPSFSIWTAASCLGTANKRIVQRTASFVCLIAQQDGCWHFAGRLQERRLTLVHLCEGVVNCVLCHKENWRLSSNSGVYNSGWSSSHFQHFAGRKEHWCMCVSGSLCCIVVCCGREGPSSDNISFHQTHWPTNIITWQFVAAWCRK